MRWARPSSARSVTVNAIPRGTDEIGDLRLSVQAKLLRALEARAIKKAKARNGAAAAEH